MGQKKKNSNGVKTEALEVYIDGVKSAEKNRNINRIFLSIFVVFSMIGVYYIFTATNDTSVENNSTNKKTKEPPKKELKVNNGTSTEK
jgi:hypothetical protein